MYHGLTTNKVDCCGKFSSEFNNKTSAPNNKKHDCKHKCIETDVIVVGSGMAGTMAMLAADKEGSKVIMLESESSLGGTTLQSGSTLWIPNLSKTKNMAEVIKSLDIPLIGPSYNNLPEGFDIKVDAMKYMCSLVHNDLYNENYAYLGLPSNTFNLISDYYDKTSTFLEEEILPYIDILRIEYNYFINPKSDDL